MTTPEKRGIHASPLQVLVDPTALPRDGFRVNREAGLLFSIVEVGFVVAAIYLAVSTRNLGFGAAPYIVVRGVSAAASYIAEQMREE